MFLLFFNGGPTNDDGPIANPGPPKPEPGPGGGNDGSGTDPDEDRDPDDLPDRDEDGDADKDSLYFTMSSSELMSDYFEVAALNFRILSDIERSGVYYWQGKHKEAVSLFSQTIANARLMETHIHRFNMRAETQLELVRQQKGADQPLEQLPKVDAAAYGALRFPGLGPKRRLAALSKSIKGKSFIEIATNHVNRYGELTKLSETLSRQLKTELKNVESGAFYDGMFGNRQMNKTEAALADMTETIMSTFKSINDEAIVLRLTFNLK